MTFFDLFLTAVPAVINAWRIQCKDQELNPTLILYFLKSVHLSYLMIARVSSPSLCAVLVVICARVSNLLGSQDRFRSPILLSHLQLGIDKLSSTPVLLPTSQPPPPESHRVLGPHHTDQQGAACFFISPMRVNFTFIQCHWRGEDALGWQKAHKSNKPLSTTTNH